MSSGKSSLSTCYTETSPPKTCDKCKWQIPTADSNTLLHRNRYTIWDLGLHWDLGYISSFYDITTIHIHTSCLKMYWNTYLEMDNYQDPSGILRNLPRHCLEISFFAWWIFFPTQAQNLIKWKAQDSPKVQTTEVCPTLCIEFTYTKGAPQNFPMLHVLACQY